MQSVMNSSHNFAQIPRADIQRSQFDRSHGYKTTFDAGYLVPVFVDEVLPGDTFNCKVTSLCRLATPLKPIMDNIFLDTFFFFVPTRLVWDNWERFNGAQDDPDSPTDYLVPTTYRGNTYTPMDIFDYYGIPPLYTTISSSFSALPFRCYLKIFNDWFRDENLQDSLVLDTDDGPDDPTRYVLQRRGKRKDYFTSCLPWPQKGPAVTIPITGQAPVSGLGKLSTNTTFPSAGATVRETAITATQTYVNATKIDPAVAAGSFYVEEDPNKPGYPGIYATLDDTISATVNAMRQAFQIQRLYERDARGGTRYNELLLAHFGVMAPDFRLQRPEYLGGGSVPVSFSPIAQNSATGATGTTTPQGNLSAMATASHSGVGFTKSFVEHGYIIGLVSARADLTYQSGLNRMYSRSTRFDFYWPALAHLGEQAVLNKEIYAAGNSADDDVWGYQERYAEYRYKPSIITGLMNSEATGTLDVWHLSQDFGGVSPALDDDFIQDDPPIDRVIAVPSQPHFIGDFFFQLKCARPMPTYSVPGLIDHF